MTCRGFIKILLKVINFLFILVGLAMIGYGIYMLVVTWSSSTSSSTPSPPPSPSSVATLYSLSPLGKLNTSAGMNVLQLRRVLLQKYSVSKFTPFALASFWTRIPSVWFLYVFIAVGVVITLITCSGYIAAATINGCCLSCYSLFVGLFMIVELALAGFVFFDENWKDVIPDDSTGELEKIEDFIDDKFDILKWAALGAIILQALALLLAVILRGMGRNPAKDYDSDDEYLAPRTIRQPLLNKATPPGTSAGAAVGVGSADRAARTDAWSTRMREKYGLDTTEFSYNPSDSSRFSSQQQPAITEVKKSCVIM